MTQINLYLSKKLEKLIHKTLISDKESKTDSINSWNVTFFYFKRQKHLLITNSETKFSIIIEKVSTKDFKNISKIFIDKLFEQLKYENINPKNFYLKENAADVYLHKTNNDKSTIGVQNNLMLFIEDWKCETTKDMDWDYRERCKSLNNIPFLKLKHHSPHKEMLAKLKIL